MQKQKKLMIFLLLIVFIIGLTAAGYFWKKSVKSSVYRPRIFILNSYHPDFPIGLVNETLSGFNDSLKKNGLKDYEVKEFDLDANRKSEPELNEAVLEAKKEIDEWKPDIIFATNDYAQKQVIALYYLNGPIPVVFANVANSPKVYGYDKAKNVAGILQKVYFKEAIALLKGLFPYVKKITVISEDNPRWLSTIEFLKQVEAKNFGVEFNGWYKVSYYQDFQSKVLFYQDKTDAFLFSPLDNLKDSSGNKVSLQETIKWLSENSHLPEISLWQTPKEGMLAAATYSSYEQGKEAGEMVVDILIKKKSPASLGFKYSEKAAQYINLARAKTLGLSQDDIPSIILINSKIFEKFPWEQ